MPSSNTCESCHIPSDWYSISNIDHSDVIAGSCQYCHAGRSPYATTKDADHISSSDGCDNCHFNAGSSWQGAIDQESVQTIVLASSAVKSAVLAVEPSTDLSVDVTQKPESSSDTNLQSEPSKAEPNVSSVSVALSNFVHPDQTANCIACHNGQQAQGKKINHLNSSEQCQACHQLSAWSPVSSFNHEAAIGQCASCHNNVLAKGQPRHHILTLKSCDDCHLESQWLPVSQVDHAATLGSCFSCHNRKMVEGKPLNHISSDNRCDNCHVTHLWSQVVMDHSNVTGSCSLCHNGATASAKTANHLSSNNTCNDCHRRRTWTPVYRVDHLAVSGSCSSCHNGQTADGKPANHPSTHNNCEDCHRSNLWSHVTFNHDNLTASCASCHAADFKQNYHKKTKGPGAIYYTANELSNCAGSCHIYEDKSFSRIYQRRRGPDHRPIRSAW